MIDASKAFEMYTMVQAIPPISNHLPKLNTLWSYNNYPINLDQYVVSIDIEHITNIITVVLNLCTDSITFFNNVRRWTHGSDNKLFTVYYTNVSEAYEIDKVISCRTTLQTKQYNATIVMVMHFNSYNVK